MSDSNEGGMSQLNGALQEMSNAMAAMQQNIRSSTQKNSVYPWNNHDFNYTQIINRDYPPPKQGISDEPCPDPFVNDCFSLVNYPTDLMMKAIPGSGEVAGKTDVDPKNTDLQTIKNTYQSWSEPYPNFSLEFPDYVNKLKQGKYASSYFLKTGTCPVKSITDKAECERRGFKWVVNPLTLLEGSADFFKGFSLSGKQGDSDKKGDSGSKSGSTPGNCFQPRYSFIDNSAGGPFGALDGLAPTVGKEVLELNPIEMYNIATTGTSSSGDFKQLPCREAFQGSQVKVMKLRSTSNLYVYLIIMVGLVLLLIFGLLSR